MPGDAFNGLALRIQQCASSTSPSSSARSGCVPFDIGGSYESRVASLRAKLLAQRAGRRRRSPGLELGAGPAPLDGYDIGPGDLVLTLLAAGAVVRDPGDRGQFRLGRPVHHPHPPESVAVHAQRAPHRLLLVHERAAPGWRPASAAGQGATSPRRRPGTSPSPCRRPTTSATTAPRDPGVRRDGGRRLDHRSTGYRRRSPPIRAAPARPRRSDPDNGPVHRARRSGNARLHRPTSPVIAAPSGYAILGSEVDIDLGGLIRPASDPIVITFIVDSTTGADPATITVSRTNADASTDIALLCDALPAPARTRATSRPTRPAWAAMSESRSTRPMPPSGSP